MSHAMSQVTIVYCRPCGYERRAREAAAALQAACNVEARLVPGTGGIFEISVGDRIVAKRAKGHFPSSEEIVAAVGAALRAPRGAPMSIHWTEKIDNLDWDELAALYRAAPLGNKAPADLRLVFSNSMFRCLALEDGRLVAAGRALADGHDCAYLCDIAVLPSHQGRGLGKEVVTRLIERCKSHRKIILYAVPGREGLYRSLGFRRMSTAMAIFADQADAHARGYLDEL